MSRTSASGAGGITTVFEQALLVFVTMKLVGAVYICGLGIQLLVRGIERPTANKTVSATNRGLHFAVEGLATCLLNPNIFLFYLAIFPQFLTETGSRAHDAATLVALYVAVNLLWFTGLARTLERLGARAISALATILHRT